MSLSESKLPSLALLPLLLACWCTVARAEILDKGVDYATQAIQIAMSDEPRSLNSTRTTDQISIFFLEHIMEGLLRRDARGRIVGGVAERWEIGDAKATFWLRPDARWSDGKPVTAADFVFGWRTVIDPATAAEYASIMYSVKNAEAINAGKLPVTALGIKALDDRTLEVELEKPTGYFAQLMTFMVFYPVREDFYKAQNGRYFADVQNMVFNGPFRLTEWAHGASFRLEKNDSYWNRDEVHLKLINIPYLTSDGLARFNLYKDGKTAVEDGILGLGQQQLKDALKQRMRIRAHPDGSVFYLEMNQREGRVMRNRNLRKALQAVSDSQELVYKVIGIPSYIPAVSLFPRYMQGVRDKFRQEYAPVLPPLDVAKGREYLALAKQELGVTELPPLSLLTSDSAGNLLQAQYLQSLYKRTLGLEIKVDAQTFKQRLEKMQNGDFDLVNSGWGPDYDDPMTFADLYASWNVNNKARYSNPAYDALIKEAQGTSNPQIRMDAMGKAQQILIDEAVILPQYERVSSVVQNRKLQGVVFQQTGASMVLTYARVVE